GSGHSAATVPIRQIPGGHERNNQLTVPPPLPIFLGRVTVATGATGLRRDAMKVVDPQFSMSYLTAPVSDPRDAADIAADTGYDFIGLRMRDPRTGKPSAWVSDRATMEGLKSRLRRSGLGVLEIEA